MKQHLTASQNLQLHPIFPPAVAPAPDELEKDAMTNAKDLIERLTNPHYDSETTWDLAQQAAAELTRLQARVAELEAGSIAAAVWIYEWMVAEKYHKPDAPAIIENARRQYQQEIANLHRLQAENAELEAENARLIAHGRGDALSFKCASEARDFWQQRAERAEAELNAARIVLRQSDALRADAERINWCEKQWADGIHIEYCAIGIGDVRVIPASTVFLRNKEYKGDSIRAAIDAARGEK